MDLLAVSNDAKTIKGERVGYLTGVMYLAPHNLARRGTVCPASTPGCRKGCLFTAGRGVMAPVYAGRMRKTQEFFAGRDAFMGRLVHDVFALRRKADRENLTPLVRLNGTSDLPWERMRVWPRASSDARNIFQYFPSLQFYDYTKRVDRMRESLTSRAWDHNYHLTFSRSEENDSECLDILRLGGNVAVVFNTPKGHALPTHHFGGYPVIDGDVNDARPADITLTPQGATSIEHRGVVVGLRAKGRARKDRSGFVVQV